MSTVSNVSLTSNVVTITTSSAHGLAALDREGNPTVVAIEDLTHIILNGIWALTSVPTTTTFTFSLTCSNISSIADSGTVVLYSDQRKRASTLKTVPALLSGTAIALDNPGKAGAEGISIDDLQEQLGSGLSVKTYGAVFDGTFHPLSERFGTLAVARAAYAVAGDGGAWILSLNESIDRVATQYAVNLAEQISTTTLKGQRILLPQGNGIWDKPVLDRPGLAQIVGSGKFTTAITMQDSEGNSGEFPAFIVIPAAYPTTGTATVPTASDSVPGGGTALRIPVQDSFYGATGLIVSELHNTDLGECDAGVTCEAWIRVNAWATDVPHTAFGCWGQLDLTLATFDCLYGLEFYSNTGTKVAYVRMFIAGVSYHFEVNLDAISASNGWHHFAVQRRLDGNFELWVDGVFRGQNGSAGPTPIVQQPWTDHFIGTGPFAWPESDPSDASAQFDIALYRLSKTVRYTTTFTAPTSYTWDSNTVVLSDFNNIDRLNVPVNVTNGAGGELSGLLIWRRYGYVLDTSFSLQGVRFVGGTMGCFLNSPHSGNFSDWSSYGTRSPMHFWTNSFANVVQDFNVQFARYGMFLSSNASLNEIRDGQISYVDWGLVVAESGLIAKHLFIFSAVNRSVFARGTGVFGLVRLEDINMTDEAQSSATLGGIEIVGANTIQITGSIGSFTTFATPALILNSCVSGIISGFSWSSNSGTSYRLEFRNNAPLTQIEIHSPAFLDSNVIPFTNHPGYIEQYGVKPMQYETVAASQTAQVLGGSGAVGDYLSGLLVIPATTSPGVVTVLDGSTSIPIFVGGSSSVSNLVPFFVPVDAESVSGAWKVTTGANVSVIGVGRFT